jgi:hypothetical protein
MRDFAKKYNLTLQPGVHFQIKENHRIPQKMGVDYFVFGRTMYCRGKMLNLPKHEFLHVAQFRKYGSFLVLMHYLFYLIINLIRYRKFGKAFAEVPFEVEARLFEKT